MSPLSGASPLIGELVVSRAGLARRLRRGGAAVAALPGLLLWALAVATYPVGSGAPPYLPAILLLLWAGPATWIASLIAGRLEQAGTHRVRLDGGALVLDQEGRAPQRIERAEIHNATIGRSGALELEIAGGRRLVLALPGDRAREVLAALGLAPGQRRAVFRWRAPGPAAAGALFGLLSPLLLLFAVRTPPVAVLTVPLFSGIPWLLSAWCAELASQQTVTVGSDGVALFLRGRRRVVTFAELREVRASGSGLDLVLEDGRVVAVLAGRHDPRLRDAMARWIASALEQARARAAGARRRVELPGSEGATFEELRAAAARTLAPSAGFRSAEVSADEVAAVLDDPTAPLRQRIAAALALSASEQASGKTTVRAAAGATVHPRLRVALEAAANDELDEEMLRAAGGEAPATPAGAAGDPRARRR